MKLYSTGGIFSITSRILVVDLLTFPNLAESITGIVVMHAEKVIATSVEAFILRIFRQKSRNGFIKAFSDIPEPFTTGFSPLTNMLKNLFLRNTLLWPRCVSLEVKLIQISSRYSYFPRTTNWISTHSNRTFHSPYTTNAKDSKCIARMYRSLSFRIETFESDVGYGRMDTGCCTSSKF